jgi:hypothetical protein
MYYMFVCLCIYRMYAAILSELFPTSVITVTPAVGVQFSVFVVYCFCKLYSCTSISELEPSGYGKSLEMYYSIYQSTCRFTLQLRGS